MRINLSFGWKTGVVVLALLVILVGSLAGGAEYYSRQSEFCGGTCHMMTEPYDTWVDSKHNTKEVTIGCVDCHYPPVVDSSSGTNFIGLRQLSSYLADPEAPPRKRAKVGDLTCGASGCHSGDAFLDKELKFKEKVSFKHKTHGQKLNCNTCHFKYSSDKHFEVPKEVCFLCHSRNTKINDGRNQCALCHVIPTKSLQKQISEDDKSKQPITHQTLIAAKVDCKGCHQQLFADRGMVKKDVCRDCHRKPESELLANPDDKLLGGGDKRKLLHDKHVVSLQANCFDCHQAVEHKQKADFLEPVRADCALCHPDHHRFQKLLLEGAERDGVASTPSLMAGVNTNCTGCHISKEHKKGQPVLIGSAKACVNCHTKEQAKLVKDWKDALSKEVKYAKELEQEARQAMAIAAARGKVPEEKLNQAQAMLEEGLQNLHIVEYGNGIHNKKYAIMLLDTAMTSFEDLIDSLAEGG